MLDRAEKCLIWLPRKAFEKNIAREVRKLLIFTISKQKLGRFHSSEHFESRKKTLIIA